MVTGSCRRLAQNEAITKAGRVWAYRYFQRSLCRLAGEVLGKEEAHRAHGEGPRRDDLACASKILQLPHTLLGSVVLFEILKKKTDRFRALVKGSLIRTQGIWNPA